MSVYATGAARLSVTALMLMPVACANEQPTRPTAELGRPVQTSAMVGRAVLPWSLDRIDQLRGSPDGTLNTLATGMGVTIYIIDSGIRTSHVEFGGRASIAQDYFPNADPDCSGHGTAMASIAAGASVGVAPDARLVGLRVGACGSPGPDLIAMVSALDWVRLNRSGPSVALLAFACSSGSCSPTVDNAVRALIASGVSVVASAGDSSTPVDASTVSPARVTEAVTVGASDNMGYYTPGATNQDVRMTVPPNQQSNFGAIVDLFAPGAGIYAADAHSGGVPSDFTYTLSYGTSPAAANVAGAVALLLEKNSRANPSQLASGLTRIASVGQLDPATLQGSPNRLVYVGPIIRLNPTGTTTNVNPDTIEVLGFDKKRAPAPADITVTLFRDVMSQCGPGFHSPRTVVVPSGQPYVTFNFTAGRDPNCPSLTITTTYTITSAVMGTGSAEVNLGAVPPAWLTLSVTR